MLILFYLNSLATQNTASELFLFKIAKYLTNIGDNDFRSGG
jgi:hypothetical protein